MNKLQSLLRSRNVSKSSVTSCVNLVRIHFFGVRCRSTVLIYCGVITSLAGHSLAIAGPIDFVTVGWYGEFTHIDPALGQVSPSRNDLPLGMQALSWSPSGTLYAVASGGLYRLSPGDGAVSFVASLGIDIRAMAVSPSGTLFAVSGNYVNPVLAQTLVSIDLTTGSSTTVGTLHGDVTCGQGMEFSPDGRLLGICPVNFSGGSYQLFTINPVTASTQLIGRYTSTAGLNQSIAFASDGSLFAIGGNTFGQLDNQTGAIISGSLRTLSGDYRGLAFVPEPGTLTLVVSAFLVCKRSRIRRSIIVKRER